MTSLDLTRISADLREKEATLLRDLLELADEDPSNPGVFAAKHIETGGDTDDDNAIESTTLSDDVAIVDRLQEDLRDVRKALISIEKGSYGVCKYCNQPIDIKRLVARPESSSCVACKKTLTQEL